MKGLTTRTAYLRRFSRSMSLIILLGCAGFSWGQNSPGNAPATGRRRTAAARLQTIQLPEANRSSGVGFEQALTRMMNLTVPSDRPLQGSQVGQLLWAGQGVAIPRGAAVVAAQPTLPMRLYVSLPDGIYTYEPVPHVLQQLEAGDQRAALAAAALGQAAGPVGGCQIIIAGVSREYSSRYGNRARSIMAVQAGLMAQSIQLQAVCEDLTFIGTADVDATAIRRVTRMGREMEPLYVIMAGSPMSQANTTQPAPSPTRSAVIIVPPAGFDDAELFNTQRLLQSASIQTVIASTRVGPITGAGGGVAQSDLLINNVVAENYDAVIFLGGPGVTSLVNNRVVLDLVRRAVATNRVIGASGNAPTILANAGVLQGVRVTAMMSEAQTLTVAGAVYTGNPVEQAGSLVTSVGPQAVSGFVRAIVGAVLGI